MKPGIKTITFTVLGVSPMLMNPMTKDTLEGLVTGVRPQLDKSRPMSDVAAEKIFRNPDGNKMGIPTINFFAALKAAGRSVKNGKKAISTATTTTMYSFLEIVETFLNFDDLDEKGELPWKTDLRQGSMKNGAASVAVGIVRPRFDNWSFTVTVKIDESILKENTFRALVIEAGRNSGLCDFRPSKGGPFGRFVIKEGSWKVEGGSSESDESPAAEA